MNPRFSPSRAKAVARDQIVEVEASAPPTPYREADTDSDITPLDAATCREAIRSKLQSIDDKEVMQRNLHDRLVHAYAEKVCTGQTASPLEMLAQGGVAVSEQDISTLDLENRSQIIYAKLVELTESYLPSAYEQLKASVGFGV